MLDADAVDAVLALARRADVVEAGGLVVEDYDMPAAAVLAWEAKAGLAANRTQVSRGGTSIARHQTAQACLAQAAAWRRRIVRGLGVPASAAGSVEPDALVAAGVLYPEQHANVSEAAAEVEPAMPRRSPAVGKLREQAEGHK